MKAKIINYMGGAFLPIPEAMLTTLGWHTNDDIKMEIVVNRDGSFSHIVLEKV